MFVITVALTAQLASAAGFNVTVEWHAPIFSGGGYCSEALAFVSAFGDVGLTANVVQHGDGYSQSFVHSQRGSGTFKKVAILSQRKKIAQPTAVVCHSEPGAWHVLQGPSWQSSPCPPPGAQLMIGRTMFETDRLPDGWPARLNAMDEVWVPTEFQREIFEGHGVERVYVLPEPVNVFAFRETGDVFDLSGDFVALSIFKWEMRKGWDILLKAWKEACRPQDSLVLVLNAYHSDALFEQKMNDFAKRNFEGRSMSEALCGNSVKVLTGLSQTELESLYRRADVLLAPTRGEGWGRPHVEAMASGTPVIATNWSGPTAFMNSDNGGPLAYELVPVAESDPSSPFKDHKWAEPSVDHLVQLINHARSFPDEWREKGRRARNDMVAHFSPLLLAEQVKARIEHLALEGNRRKRKRQTSSAEL